MLCLSAIFRMFAILSPGRFVRDVLIGELNAAAVVCGYNFTFGRGAVGNGALLSALMEERGRRCYVMPEVTLGGLHVSSTEIRRLLSAGDVAGAARLLADAMRCTERLRTENRTADCSAFLPQILP